MFFSTIWPGELIPDTDTQADLDLQWFVKHKKIVN